MIRIDIEIVIQDMNTSAANRIEMLHFINYDFGAFELQFF